MAFKRRQGTIGDAFSDASSGWYSYEFEFPRYEWSLTQQIGDGLADFVRSRFIEAVNDITAIAASHGFKFDEFVATMTYNLMTTQTNERLRNGKPAWGGAEHVPIFTERGPNAQRIESVIEELESRIRMIGNNEIAALQGNVKFLKKYDFAFVRPDNLTLRFQTEKVETLADAVKPSIIKDLKEENAKNQEEEKKRREAIAKKNKAKRRRKQLYAIKHGLPWPPPRKKYVPPPTDLFVPFIEVVRKDPATGKKIVVTIPNPRIPEKNKRLPRKPVETVKAAKAEAKSIVDKAKKEAKKITNTAKAKARMYAERAAKAAITRAANLKAKEIAFKKRSAAAKKAAKTRESKLRAKEIAFKKRSDAAKRGAMTRIANAKKRAKRSKR